MRFLRRLTAPASDSQLTWALALSLVMMAILLMALLWQSSVINYQRDLIRSLWSWRFGG